jgi:hypothetical protein
MKRDAAKELSTDNIEVGAVLGPAWVHPAAAL